MFTVVALFRKFYFTQQRPRFAMMEGDSMYRSNRFYRSITYTYYIARIRRHTHTDTQTHTRTVIPSRNDMASTKMRVFCSHWYCFAHLRKKDRSKAPHIHTRSSLRFFFFLDLIWFNTLTLLLIKSSSSIALGRTLRTNSSTSVIVERLVCASLL